MKIKFQIKNRFTGNILFEFEKDDNTIKDTLLEAINRGADLQGADLQGAYLQGAYLQGAYLRGAYLQGAYLRGAYLRVKIKSVIVFTGLYDYFVIPYITEENEKRVKMGCFDRSLKEWEENFWNNDNEFPNNGSVKSNLRLMAFETAKKWLEIVDKQ